jgi:hypothetical protein
MSPNLLAGLLGQGAGPIGGAGSDEEGKIPLEALLGLGARAGLTSLQQGKLPIMGIMENPSMFLPKPNKGPNVAPPTAASPMSAPSSDMSSQLTPEQFEKLKNLLNSQQA